MSIKVARYITCEECGRPSQVVFGDSDEARKVAKEEEGFVRRRKQDLCPVCAGMPGEYVHGIWVPQPPAVAAAA